VDEHASGLTVSGFSFGHSGIVARIYDKTREIREKSKDKKWLYLVWGEKGWVGTETVWRVEVQIRREALGELVAERTRVKLGLDDLEGIRNALASIWGYAVGGKHGHTAWLKWCVPSEEDARRSRWDAKPEWQVIQRADWGRCEPFELAREHVPQARWDMLLPQWVGLTRGLAALSGPARWKNDRGTWDVEPTAGDFERHLDAYVLKRRKSEGGATETADGLWTEWVQEARVERRERLARILTTQETEERLTREADARREKRSRQLVASF
jgi:hypothetical protein